MIAFINKKSPRKKRRFFFAIVFLRNCRGCFFKENFGCCGFIAYGNELKVVIRNSECRDLKSRYSIASDCKSAATGNNVSNNRNAQTSWIDLFGWGTSGWNSGATEYQPWSSVAGYSRYYPGNGSDNDLTGTYAQADWGVYNSIGSDSAGTWRTPTKDEWEYLINTRNTTSGIRYAKATVNGVTGLIIVPDNWSTSTYAFNSTSTNSQTAAYTTNDINAATWTTLENAGCVFLPNAGHRYEGNKVDHQGVSGLYWSSTHYSSPYYASILYVANDKVRIDCDDKSNGASVRMIKEF